MLAPGPGGEHELAASASTDDAPLDTAVGGLLLERRPLEQNQTAPAFA